MTVNRSSFTMDVVQDESPDLSYLGEYSNKPGRNAIDRQARGDMGRGEFRYFNGSSDDSQYLGDQYSRAEAYNAGQWHMVGVRAVVKVSIPIGTSFVVHTIRSPGLWGIESDSGADYIAEVFGQECETLATMLEGMGLEVVDDTSAVEGGAQ